MIIYFLYLEQRDEEMCSVKQRRGTVNQGVL